MQFNCNLEKRFQLFFISTAIFCRAVGCQILANNNNYMNAKVCTATESVCLDFQIYLFRSNCSYVCLVFCLLRFCVLFTHFVANVAHTIANDYHTFRQTLRFVTIFYS